jgi:ankyrin repeat protein
MMEDEAGFTLLQLAANKNSDKILIMLCNYILRNQSSQIDDKTDTKPNEAQLKLTHWINSRGGTSDGFTALHYSAFYGNLRSIKYLIEHGADISIVNHHRINVMHVAAQGDSALALCYFKKLGMDINTTEKNGSTPLHWAAFSG